MRQCTKLLLLLFCCVGIFSCKRPKPADSISVDFELIRMDVDVKAIQASSPEHCNMLSNKHPGVFQVYSSRIVGLDCAKPGEIERFLADTFISGLYAETEKVFSETSALEKDFYTAYQHMAYYFPDYRLPKVYTMVSGTRFPGALLNDSSMLLGLDLYLGADCIYYQGFEDYVKHRYAKEYMVPNTVNAFINDILMQNESVPSPESSAIEQMVFHGKRLYIASKILPGTSDSLLIGYTNSKLSWCTENEASVWAYLVDHELIFNTDPDKLQRLLGDGPFSAGLPKESPGRIGHWVGWQIVKAFMEKNPELDFMELLLFQDSNTVLKESAYRP